eukprot:768702-Hanusia_phi.AAC.5
MWRADCELGGCLTGLTDRRSRAVEAATTGKRGGGGGGGKLRKQTVLSVYHQKIPPTANLEQRSADIPAELRIAQKALEAPGGRKAAVSWAGQPCHRARGRLVKLLRLRRSQRLPAGVQHARMLCLDCLRPPTPPPSALPLLGLKLRMSSLEQPASLPLKLLVLVDVAAERQHDLRTDVWPALGSPTRHLPGCGEMRGGGGGSV